MADRFYTDSSFVDGKLTLSEEQSHHVANVMRANVGAHIVVFDGAGNEFQTEIVERSKKRVVLQHLETRRPERRLSRSIRIIAALPKGDRQKFMVEKLVELGVETLIPLETSRSVAQVNAKVLGRIQKQIIEATKQCRRSYLMEVTPPMSMNEALAMASSGTGGFYLAHPYTQTQLSTLSDELAQHDTCHWLIGPEGGFSDDEFERAVATGWTPISFGEIILRVETAAMAVAVSSANCGK